MLKCVENFCFLLARCMPSDTGYKPIRMAMAIESILFDNILELESGSVKYHSNIECKHSK